MLLVEIDLGVGEIVSANEHKVDDVVQRICSVVCYASETAFIFDV
jgi:hypothetical protein